MAGWDIEYVLRTEIRDGERLVWWGAPARGAIVVRSIFPIGFGLLFAAFPIGMGTAAVRETSGWETVGLLAFLSIFLAAGLGIAFAGVMAIARAGQVAYGVTDRRVLIVSRVFRLKVQDFGPRDITGVERTERADGSGTVVFHKETTGTGEDRRTTTEGFYGVRDVRAAAAAIEALRPEMAFPRRERP